MSSVPQKKGLHCSVFTRTQRCERYKKGACLAHAMLRFHGSISSGGCTQPHTTWGFLQLTWHENWSIYYYNCHDSWSKYFLTKKNNHICTSCVVPSNILTLCMIWISPWGHHLICSFGWLSDWPENVELIILRVWKTWIESESMPLPLLAVNEQNLGNFPFSPQTQWFLWPKKFWHFNLDIIYVILAFI